MKKGEIKSDQQEIKDVKKKQKNTIDFFLSSPMCLFSEAGVFKRIVSKGLQVDFSGAVEASGGEGYGGEGGVWCATTRNLERRGDLRTGLE